MAIPYNTPGVISNYVAPTKAEVAKANAVAAQIRSDLAAKKEATAATTGALPAAAPVTTAATTGGLPAVEVGVQLPKNLMGGVGAATVSGVTAAPAAGGLTVAPTTSFVGPAAPAGLDKPAPTIAPLTYSPTPITAAQQQTVTAAETAGPAAPVGLGQPAPTVSPISISPTPTGAPLAAADKLSTLYSDVLGRADAKLTDPEGFQYWLNTIGADNAITPEEEEIWKKAAAPELAQKATADFSASEPGQEAKTFYEANKSNPALIYQYALGRGLTQEQLASVTGMTNDQVKAYFDPILSPNTADQRVD
jgi:hypothetical protein